jgi:hypothetical protein
MPQVYALAARTRKPTINNRLLLQEKEPESKRASSPFCDFFALGAGVTPAAEA